MPTLPTIKIQNPKDKRSFVIINERDYNPKKHVLWVEPDEAPDKPQVVKATVPEPEPEPETTEEEPGGDDDDAEDDEKPRPKRIPTGRSTKKYFAGEGD